MGEQVNINENKEEEGSKCNCKCKHKQVEGKEEEEAAPAAAAEEAEKKEEEEEQAAAEASDAGSKLEEAQVVILGVELHCTGCAKRIRRCIERCKGVEGVEVDMAANQLTVSGIVDPQALCARLRQKTLRSATVISPPPPADQPVPSVVHSQLVSDVTTVELLVNMHCEACAQQLHKKILKMRGVQSADTNFSAGKLTVTGTVSGEKLSEYIHRRTGKLATVVEAEKIDEPPAPEADKKEENKEEEKAAAEDSSKQNEEKQQLEGGVGDEKGDNNKADQPVPDEEAAADAPKLCTSNSVVDGFPPEEMMKRILYWPPYAVATVVGAGAGNYYSTSPTYHGHTSNSCAPMNLHYTASWVPPPPPPVYYSTATASSYMVQRPPPAPQMFSDENPNACAIS